MKIEVSLEAKLCDDDCTDEEVASTFGSVMEALVDAGVEDPFVGGSVGTRQLEITVVVDADSEPAALERGMALIKTALKSIGLDLSPEPSSPSLAWSSTSIRPAV
ncbi:MAG: hypothetical protein ACRDKJ_09795 [Actinomycetota bacterium]